MKIIYAAVAATCLAASPAIAADDGFYVGAGIGYYQLDIGGGWDAGDTGFKITGGYNFLKYFGAEVEWIYGGSPKKYGVTIDVDGWNFSAVGHWPVTDQFNLFGQVGAIMWNADAHVPGFGNGSDDGTDFSWGLGAGWNFTEHFTLNGEYQSFDIENTNNSDLWSVSGIWRF